MFDTWTDEQFYPWLAGFFDGEGCVYLHIKQQHSVDVSISNTNRAVIEGIYNRVRLGSLSETTYTKAEWKTKYTWRIRSYDDAHAFLSQLLPFLIIKRDAAIEAIHRVDMAYAIRNAMIERNQEIRAMKKQGTPSKEIAKVFEMSVASINAIVAGKYYESTQPRNHIKRKMTSYMERTVNKHAGTTPNVRTQVTKIPSLPAPSDKESHSH